MIKRIAVTAFAVTAIAGLAACQGGSHPGAIKASASALATNKAVVHDESIARNDVTGCFKSIPVTQIAAHPFKSGHQGLTCLERKTPSKTAFRSCAGPVISANLKTLARKDLTPTETGLANCLAQAGTVP